METWFQRIFLVLGLAPALVCAQQVEPDISQSSISENVLDSENWLLGLRGGMINIEDFGSSALGHNIAFKIY